MPFNTDQVREILAGRLTKRGLAWVENPWVWVVAFKLKSCG
jgi:hypothetical protein